MVTVRLVALGTRSPFVTPGVRERASRLAASRLRVVCVSVARGIPEKARVTMITRITITITLDLKLAPEKRSH